MKDPKILYILIGIFCVFAIIAGIYAQFVESGTPVANTATNTDGNNVVVQKSQETIKNEFNELFNNTINLNNYDTTGIKRINAEQEIVYTIFDIQQREDAYEINIKVPAFNINNKVINSFNEITENNFIAKAREVLANKDTSNKAIYSIDYTGYVNGDILSVAIRSTLKQGTSAQRVMIQTYNYNLITEEEVDLTDLITYKALNKEDVNQEIQRVVKEADDAAKAVQDMGYGEIYTRNLEDEIYSVDGSNTYLLGPDEQLYIIYPYGNKNLTSEMDIVLFE